MHIAFAVLFFFYVGLSETLRHGVFGLSPSETTGITYGALALIALVILRGDVVFVVRRPPHPLYGSARLNWSWRRTMLGILLAPLLWVIPLAYGLSLIQINFTPLPAETFIQLVLTQVLLAGLAEELFFREAAIKAYSADTGAIYVISVLAFFIFHMPHGVPVAMIAAGSGMYYLTLRLIGTNLLVVALLHGLTTVLFTRVLALGLTSNAIWGYAACFLGAAALLSVAVFQMFARNRSKPLYA